MSRYYDTNTYRFINSDSRVSTGNDLFGSNMYAYCENNPIVRFDPKGEWFGFDTIVGAVVGATVSVASQLISDTVNSVLTGSLQFSSVGTYVGAAVGGAVEGAITTWIPFNGLDEIAGGFCGDVVGGLVDLALGGNRTPQEIIGDALLDTAVNSIIDQGFPIKSKYFDNCYENDLIELKNLSKNGSKFDWELGAIALTDGWVSDVIGDANSIPYNYLMATQSNKTNKPVIFPSCSVSSTVSNGGGRCGSAMMF